MAYTVRLSTIFRASRASASVVSSCKLAGAAERLLVALLVPEPRNGHDIRLRLERLVASDATSALTASDSDITDGSRRVLLEPAPFLRRLP